MTWFKSISSRYAAVGVLSAALGFLVAWPVFATAQDKKDPAPDPAAKQAPPAGGPTEANKDLAEQIKQLNAKVARLEAALPKTASAAGGGIAASGAMPAGGMKDDAMGGMGGPKKGMAGAGGAMGGMKDGDDMMEMMQMMGMMKMMKMMGGMKDDAMGGMGGAKKGMAGGGMGMMEDMMGGGKKPMAGGGMKDDAMGGMGMMDDDMDMMGMMGMGSMGGSKGKKMKMATALPGFPGASHIYHIGATAFFLDHPEHITLTTEQKTKLGQMKQKAVMEKASAQRKIDDAEQQLWDLTAADMPDAAKIDAKVREVEKFRGDQRLAFIRTVGEGALVLTDDQRKILIGQAQPAPKTAPDPHAAHPKTP